MFSGLIGRSNCQNCLLYFIPFYGCYLLAKQRSEIRGLRNIPGSLASKLTNRWVLLIESLALLLLFVYIAADLLCHLTCHCCSLTQENNEATAVHQDIITALGARGLQVIVQGIFTLISFKSQTSASNQLLIFRKLNNNDGHGRDVFIDRAWLLPWNGAWSIGRGTTAHELVPPRHGAGAKSRG